MKKLIIILALALILCFTVDCQDKAAMAELEEFKARAALEEQNKEIVKRLYEEFNKGNVEIATELCASDYSFYYPSNNPNPLSREERIGILKEFLRVFPDFHWRIDELIAVGNKVITRVSMSGTHEGEYQGISATGNKVKNSAIFITHIENGMIVEDREEDYALGMMMQLGMELKPKEGEK